jgi:cellulase/cellobiase CelA1
MPTKDEIATAIKVLKEVSGNPSTGAIKELLDLLDAPAKEAKDFTPVTETRVAEVKETR